MDVTGSATDWKSCFGSRMNTANGSDFPRLCSETSLVLPDNLCRRRNAFITEDKTGHFNELENFALAFAAAPAAKLRQTLVVIGA